MKYLKKFIILNLLLITMFAISLTAEAAVKLTKNVEVGQEFVVTSYKKKAKVNKKKMFSVSKRGSQYTFTALKSGTAKITTYNKKGKTAKVYTVNVVDVTNTTAGNPVSNLITSYKKPKTSNPAVATLEKVKKNVYKIVTHEPGTATITFYNKKKKKMQKVINVEEAKVTQLQYVASEDRRHTNTSNENTDGVTIKVDYVGELPIKSNHTFTDADWTVKQYDANGKELPADQMKAYKVEAKINPDTKKATIHAYLTADFEKKDVKQYDVVIVPNTTPYSLTSIKATCKKEGYKLDEKPAAADFVVTGIYSNPLNTLDNHTEELQSFAMEAYHKAGFWYCTISTKNPSGGADLTVVVKVPMVNDSANGRKIVGIKVTPVTSPVDYAHEFSTVAGEDLTVKYLFNDDTEEDCTEFKVEAKGDHTYKHFDTWVTDLNYRFSKFIEIPYTGEKEEETEMGISAKFVGETVPKGHVFTNDEFTVVYTTNYENTSPCTDFILNAVDNEKEQSYTVTITDSAKGFTTDVNVPYQLAQTDDIDPLQTDPEFPDDSKTQTGLELICNKTEYQKSEQPSTVDVVVNNVFSDGSKEQATTYKFNAEMSNSVWTLSAESNGFVSNKVEVPVVNNIVDTTISADQTPVSYGDNNAVISAVTVTDVYADGSTAPCTNYKFEVYEWNTSEKVAKVRVTCNGGSNKILETTVPYEAKKVSLELQKWVNSYTGDYSFNASDFEVVILYDDGTKEVVSDYSHEETENLANGEVTVKFTKDGFEKTITISKSVEAPDSIRED